MTAAKTITVKTHLVVGCVNYPQPGVVYVPPTAPQLPLQRFRDPNLGPEYCELCSDALASCCAILTCYTLCGMMVKEKHSSALNELFSSTHRQLSDGTFRKVWKWKLAAAFSDVTEQIQPTRPKEIGKDEKPVLAGGIFYAFQKLMRRSWMDMDNDVKHRRGARFAQSVLQLKKGMPRPGEWELEEAEDAFGPTMSKPEPSDERIRVQLVSGGEEIDVTLDDVLPFIRKVVQELVRGKPLRNSDLKLAWMSASAHFESSRNKGGAFPTVATSLGQVVLNRAQIERLALLSLSLRGPEGRKKEDLEFWKDFSQCVPIFSECPEFTQVREGVGAKSKLRDNKAVVCWHTASDPLTMIRAMVGDGSDGKGIILSPKPETSEVTYGEILLLQRFGKSNSRLGLLGPKLMANVLEMAGTLPRESIQVFSSDRGCMVKTVIPGTTIALPPRHPASCDDRIECEDPATVWFDGTSKTDRKRVGVLRRLSFWKVLDASLRERNLVKACALAEALKVRTISLGPGLRYSVAHTLQKYLFRVLKDRQWFVNDRPVTADLIKERLGPLSPGEMFLSGDFVGATDNLRSRLSEEVVDVMCEELGLDQSVSKVFLESLTRHTVVRKSDGQEFVQSRGQLMGSPTSFPVLCIVNLALAWMSLGDGCPLERFRCMVNGDDLLVKCRPDRFKVWEAIVGLGGLQSSVGKTYLSAFFAIINSMYFDTRAFVSTGDVSAKPIEVPFFNLGLLMGIKRSGKDSCVKGTKDLKSWGAISAEFILKHETEIQVELLELFLSRQRRNFPHGKIPWFLPEAHGGLGIPALGKYQVDSFDRRLCAEMRAKKLKPPKPELSTGSVDGVRRVCETVLKTWCGTTSVKEGSDLHVEMDEAISRAVGHLSWRCFLTGGYGRTDLWGMEPKGYTKLIRFWDRLSRRSGYHESGFRPDWCPDIESIALR